MAENSSSLSEFLRQAKEDGDRWQYDPIIETQTTVAYATTRLAGHAFEVLSGVRATI